MKKVILIPIWLVLLAIGAYLGPLLLAQAPEQAAPKVRTATKVAVINIRAVLKQNQRAKAFEAELEESLKPHKMRAKKLSDEIDALSVGNQGNPGAGAKKKSEWEAVNDEIIQLIEEKHKEKMPEVWKEVNQGIDAVAKAYGFQLVLGYGDPDDAEVKSFQSVKNSKVRTMDMGCTAMLYLHGSVDITQAVIDTLHVTIVRPPSIPKK